MQIQSLTSPHPGHPTARTSTPLPQMDANAFMLVLLAQMRHQNPLEPMDDKEMIAQMTQLNSLQELQKIRLTLEMLVQAEQHKSGQEVA